MGKRGYPVHGRNELKYMPAAYDSYDYPNYWKHRGYEHQSEVIAIKAFLRKIPKITTALEIGAGYGRLADIYSYRVKRLILSDPSGKLLKIARENIKNKKTKFVHSTIQNLSKKVKPHSADLIVMVRVMHHLDEPEEAIETIERLLTKDGYLILEFANKRHIKAMIERFLKGDFTFIADIFPKDIRSKRNIKANTLPFINYHPDLICHLLEKHNFKIIEKRSVSNIRLPFIKTILPIDILLFIEKYMQELLSHFKLGPSIFVLAKKNDS